MSIRTWHCAYGHVFEFGDEDWHMTENQGFLDEICGEPDHSPIPRYCTEEFDSIDFPDMPGMWGEPCMDSTSLIYD